MMQYGIVHLSSVALRAEAREPAELVTQVLFGETYQVLSTPVDGWLRVRTYLDQYEGWLSKAQYYASAELAFEPLAQYYTLAPVAVAHNAQRTLRLVSGSRLPSYQLDNQRFVLSGEVYQIDHVPYHHAHYTVPDLVEYARQYLAVPYLWGGRTPFGIDCSGLVQLLMRAVKGVFLPRDASQQAHCGEAVKGLAWAATGDVAFFVREGRIVHTGIILEGAEAALLLPPSQTISLEEFYILHAYDAVRVDKLDTKGIWNLDTHQYTHQLHNIQRVASAQDYVVRT